jgi:ferredoxin
VGKRAGALTVEQIEERFHKVFKREMTPIERVAFFLPYPD